MIAALKHLIRKAFPTVPPEIADDFNVLRVSRLHNQCRWLCLALFLTIPTAIFAASQGASVWVRIILPLCVGALFLYGFFSLMRLSTERLSKRGARKFIAESTWSSPIVAVLCSVWCVMSWWSASAETKIYYPMILSMGSLTTVYCLSSVRKAAILNLVIGMFPICLLMMFSGDRLNFAASVSLLMASGFLLQMIFQQHDQWVDLLMLKRRLQDQANSDPLTGLLNRRGFSEALCKQMENTGEDQSFCFGLLDLDGFKPVNDQYGHDVGDKLLCEVAIRLTESCGKEAVVARIGGDEFAIIWPAAADLSSDEFAARALTSLVAPCRIEAQNIRISASIGLARWQNNGETAEALFKAADLALYAAKAENKPRRYVARHLAA